MSARDKYHSVFREALQKDGWIITHDPYFLILGKTEYEVDIGAEKLIAAQKGALKIAVEIKSFLNDSIAHDFHEALGQYLQYRLGIEFQEPDRQVFLAVSEERYARIIQLTLPRLSIEKFNIYSMSSGLRKLTAEFPRPEN